MSRTSTHMMKRVGRNMPCGAHDAAENCSKCDVAWQILGRTVGTTHADNAFYSGEEVSGYVTVLLSRGWGLCLV